MRKIFPLLKLNLILAIVIVAGCGPSTSTRQSTILGSSQVSPGLVTGIHPEMAPPAQDPWLQGRNDDQMGSYPRWQDGYDEWVETHSREILWTHNGRPQESTRTRTEITRRRSSR